MFNLDTTFRPNHGGNVRNSRCAHPQREQRRASAKVRQAAYDKLTIQQKLDGLVPGGSNRQRERLMAQLAKNNLAVVMKAEAKKK